LGLVAATDARGPQFPGLVQLDATRAQVGQ
jgi:hypothetical protein